MMNDELSKAGRERPKCAELAAEVVQYVVLRWGQHPDDVVGDRDFYETVRSAAKRIYGDE